MRLLDLFCKAGGASMGYHRAGFEVTGVDIEPQPHYPFRFVQADALEYVAAHGHEFDAIAASPPCQRFTEFQKMHKKGSNHPDLIEPTRRLLIAAGRPYVIENVPGAPLDTPFMLCGTMFDLKVPRHRLFESNIPLPFLIPPCNHKGKYDPYHGGEDSRGERYKMADAIGINWFMTREEVRNAIPPAYTEYIGKHLMECLTAQAQVSASSSEASK